MLGGDNPTENAAIKLSEILKQYFTGENAVAPFHLHQRQKLLLNFVVIVEQSCVWEVVFVKSVVIKLSSRSQ
ncbi:MAG: hypothetical protein QNJ68_12695 [Microcoleaceae cyanobacterium MO_207.B10]|nr:hypothetical protein [Microcoleaceae cyanobacterium MO_207.B10]